MYISRQGLTENQMLNVKKMMINFNKHQCRISLSLQALSVAFIEKPHKRLSIGIQLRIEGSAFKLDAIPTTSNVRKCMQ